MWCRLASSRATALWGLIVAAAVLACYFPALSFGFLAHDDPFHIVQNPYLNPPRWSGLVRLWTSTYFSEYVPLAHTMWAAENWVSYQFSPPNASPSPRPWVFHLGNILLHVGCSLCVLLIGREMLAVVMAPGIAALVFALHPIQVEAVAWVSETRGLLSGLLGLLALWLYLRSLRAPNQSGTLTSGLILRRSIAYALSMLAFILSLFAKSSAVAAIPIAAVLHFTVARRDWRGLVSRLTPWLIIALLFVALMRSIQTNDEISFFPTLGQRVVIANDAIWFYVRKMAVPVGLGHDYGRAPAVVLASTTAKLLPVASIAAILAIIVMRPPRIVAAMLLVFVCGLLPTLGLIPFVFQEFSTVADRFAYLSVAGLAMALGTLATTGGRIRLDVTFLLLCFLAFSTVRQVSYWRNEHTLVERTLAVNPRSIFGHAIRSKFAADANRPDDAQRELRQLVALCPELARPYWLLAENLRRYHSYREAEQACHAGLARFPTYPLLLVSLGKTYSALNEPQQAIVHFELALKHGTRRPSVLTDLASALARQGNRIAAMSAIREALALRHDDVDARSVLIQLLIDEGNYSAVANELVILRQQLPDNMELDLALVNAWMRCGQYQLAVACCREVLGRIPDEWRMLNQLAWLLATSPDADLPANAAEALQLAGRACALRPAEPALLDTLAAAHAAAGDYPQAVEIARRAARLAFEKGDLVSSELMTKRAEVYASGKPWRDRR